MLIRRLNRVNVFLSWSIYWLNFKVSSKTYEIETYIILYFDEKHQDCETVDSGLLFLFSEQGPGHLLPAESLVVWISSEAGSVSGAHCVHCKPHQSHVRGGNKAASILDNSIFTIIEQRMPWNSIKIFATASGNNILTLRSPELKFIIILSNFDGRESSNCQIKNEQYFCNFLWKVVWHKNRYFSFSLHRAWVNQQLFKSWRFIFYLKLLLFSKALKVPT